MQPLSIFVSSICYDLKALREDLRSKLMEMGHNPILSEYSSSPVSPDLTSVENCKKVVRESADILVLIIGGKRGSIDPKTNRSVVNVEYNEAKFKGIDCIVFIDQNVYNHLPTFKKNPTADFTPTIDDNDVFRFIEEIQKELKWIFQFNSTDEITRINPDTTNLVVKLVEINKVRRLIVL
jgi:hypothetical protein